MSERRTDRSVSFQFYDLAEFLPLQATVRVSSTCRIHELEIINNGIQNATILIADQQSPSVPWVNVTLVPGGSFSYGPADRGKQMLNGFTWSSTLANVSASGMYSV